MNILNAGRKVYSLNPWDSFSFNIQRFKDLNLEALGVFDFDETLFPWITGKYREEWNEHSLNENQEAIKAVYGRMVCIGATGIDWNSAREASSLLKGYPPFDFVSTGNGVELRVNFYSEENAQWMDKNRLVQSEPLWNQFMENCGWIDSKFLEVVQEKLQSLKFRKLKKGEALPTLAYKHQTILKREKAPPAFAVFSSGEPAIYLVKDSRYKDSDYITLEKEIIEAVKEQYEIETNSQINPRISNHGYYDYLFFSPVSEIEINKAVVFDAVLNAMPKEKKKHLKVLIAAGDTKNDRHLYETEIDGIPVCSIRSGNALEEDKTLSAHPRLFTTPEGNISLGIRQIFETIDK